MPFLYLLAMALLTSLRAGTFVTAPEGKERSNTARRLPPQAVRCGPNALYIFLRMHGWKGSAEVFFWEIAPGQLGLSLTELRDSSTRYGIPADVRCCTYEQLAEGNALPLIALMQPWRESDSRGAGHYVVVVDADPDGITLLDGTSGKQTRLSRDAFCHNWKGFVVVESGNRSDGLLLALSVAAWMLLAWLIFRANRSGTRENRSIG